MQKCEYPPVRTVSPGVAIGDAVTPVSNGSGTDRCLLVLLLDSDMDMLATARKILEAAEAFDSRIHLLGLYTDRSQESGLRRQIAMLSALIQDANIPVELTINSDRDWLAIVKSNWREGDMLACFAGQRTSTGRTLPGLLIESNFPATVYVIGGEFQAEQTKPNRRSTILAWAGFIGILLGFFWLQVKIDQALSNWLGMVMLILSVLVEAWLLWVWNGMVG